MEEKAEEEVDNPDQEQRIHLFETSQKIPNRNEMIQTDEWPCWIDHFEPILLMWCVVPWTEVSTSANAIESWQPYISAWSTNIKSHRKRKKRNRCKKDHAFKFCRSNSNLLQLLFSNNEIFDRYFWGPLESWNTVDVGSFRIGLIDEQKTKECCRSDKPLQCIGHWVIAWRVWHDRSQNWHTCIHTHKCEQRRNPQQEKSNRFHSFPCLPSKCANSSLASRLTHLWLCDARTRSKDGGQLNRLSKTQNCHAALSTSMTTATQQRSKDCAIESAVKILISIDFRSCLGCEHEGKDEPKWNEVHTQKQECRIGMTNNHYKLSTQRNIGCRKMLKEKIKQTWATFKSCQAHESRMDDCSSTK